MDHYIQKCNALLADLPDGREKRQLHLDTFHTPYLQFDHSVEWPSVHTTGMEPSEKFAITELLARWIPDLIAGCSVLEQPIPRRDLTTVHFVKVIQINSYRYLYLLRILSDYMGGALSEEIVAKGKQGISPSFRTDRVYFTSRIIPVRTLAVDGEGITFFESDKIKLDTIFHEFDTSGDIWSSVVFDEVDFTVANQKLQERFSFGADWKPNKFFFPFVIDYNTFCQKLLFPTGAVVDRMASLFHALFASCVNSELEQKPLDDAIQEGIRTYYTDWEFERFLSRGGNPHWRIKRHPFVDSFGS